MLSCFWRKKLTQFALLSVIPVSACNTTARRSSLRDAVGSQSEAVWTSEGGNVLLNGQVFHLKGANWFGLETGSANLLGLDKRSMASMLDWLQSENFNSLRIPISVQWSLDMAHVAGTQVFTEADADLRGKPWVDVLDKLLREAAKRGIVVMLDMHTVGAGDNLTTKRWYSDKYSVCDFRQAWQLVLNRFGDRWNIFALDLKNELHDVDWGNGETSGTPKIACRNQAGPIPAPAGFKPTDWRQEVESLVPELAIERWDGSGRSFRYQGLYLVQGMHHGIIGQQPFPYDVARPFGFWFGGNLEGIRNYPLRLPANLANRIAYTVHVYGPSVYPQPYFDELDGYRNPQNLDVVYESQNGYIEPLTQRALIIGEWGGINAVLEGRDDPAKKGKDDAAILGAIAKWFSEHCIADAFWWAINPESTDTGGLLSDDYATPLTPKLERARSMQPKPTRLAALANGSFTVADPGEFNPQCLSRKSPAAAVPQGQTRCDGRYIKLGNAITWECFQNCVLNAFGNGECDAAGGKEP